MANRPQLKPVQVLPAPQSDPANSGDMSVGLTSAPTILSQLSMCSYSFSWSGTDLDGNISIECSNDYALNPDGTVENAGTWNTMTFTLNGSSVSQLPVASDSGNGFADIDQIAAWAIRAVYIPNAGTGQLKVVFNGKVS